MLNYFIFILLFYYSAFSQTNNDSYIYDNSSLSYPRIMWSFYDRPLKPAVKEMFDITYENVGSKWKFIYLTYDNLSLFLNTSTFPSHFYRLLPSHQSDYIRMRLLEQYGGWWLDTTLLINDNNIMEEFYKEIVEKKADFFGLCNLQCPRKLIETSFMYAPKGSVVMKNWKDEMEEVHRIGQKNYLYKTYREGVTFPSMIFEDHYPYAGIYMTVFVAQQKVFDRLMPRNTSLLLKRAKATIFKMQKYCKKNNISYGSIYFDKEKREKFPLIKVNSWLRRILFPDQDTVTAYGKHFDPVEFKSGNEGYEKRLYNLIIEFIIYIGIIIIAFCFQPFFNKLIKKIVF